MKSSQVKWSEELYYWLDVKALVVEYNEVKSSEVKSYTIDLMLKH